MSNWFIDSIAIANHLERSKDPADIINLRKCKKSLIIEGIKHRKNEKNESTSKLASLPPEYLDYLLSQFEKFIESEGGISLEKIFGLTPERINSTPQKNELYIIAMAFSIGFIDGLIDKISANHQQFSLSDNQILSKKKAVLIAARVNDNEQTVDTTLCHEYGYTEGYTDDKKYCKARIIEFLMLLFAQDESNAKRQSNEMNTLIQQYTAYYKSLKTIEKNTTSIDSRRAQIKENPLIQNNHNLQINRLNASR